MSTISLLYHDVVELGRSDDSGLAGVGAAKYKLDRAVFEAHLDVLVSRLPGCCVDVNDAGRARGGPGYMLTFDDGGVSAAHAIADALDARGLVGHFFIVSGFVDARGFVTRAHVRDLSARGHVIGTHSHSHPERMSSLSPRALYDEWKRSADDLADIVGAPVRVGSVPKGDTSRAVAEAAAAAGLAHLFTSEPTTRVHMVRGCAVMGRHSVVRGMSAPLVGALATGAAAPRARQWLAWNARKAAKRVGGELYLRARRAILRRAQERAAPAEHG